MNAIGIVEKIQNSGKFQGGTQAEKGDEREKREAAEAVEQWKMKLCQVTISPNVCILGFLGYVN